MCVWVRRSVFLSNLCSGQDACQTSLGVLENGVPVLSRLSSGKIVRVRLHIRVRMLVRTSTYARSCICAMAPKAHGLVLVIGFSSWRISWRPCLYVNPFSYICFSTYGLFKKVSSSLYEAGQHVQGVMSKVMGYQRIKRARSAREDSSAYIYIYIYTYV